MNTLSVLSKGKLEKSHLISLSEVIIFMHKCHPAAFCLLAKTNWINSVLLFYVIER